jgi:hypothetical protein
MIHEYISLLHHPLSHSCFSIATPWSSVKFCLIGSYSVAMFSCRSQWSRSLMRLHSLEHWDRGFESHSRHGCLFAFILCLCCSVCRLTTLRWAGPPSKESYQLCIGLRNWKSDQGPTKYCRAIDRQRERDRQTDRQIDVFSFHST